MAEEEAIIEERREFNEALELARGKKPKISIEPEPWDKNKRAIERIEELLDKEKQLHTRLEAEEKDEVAKGGDVV